MPLESNKQFLSRLKREGREQDFERWAERARLSLSARNPDWSAAAVRSQLMSDAKRQFKPATSSLTTGDPLSEPHDDRPVSGGRTGHQRLLDVALNLDEPADIQTELQWVYSNLPVPWHRIDPHGVPSVGAVGLLESAKSDPVWFYQTYHAKTMPTRADIERSGSERVDKTRIDELIMSAFSADELAVLQSESLKGVK